MSDKFHNSRGQLTAFAYACGYTECVGLFTLSYENEVYFVRGWNAADVHHSKAFRTIRMARAYAYASR